MTQSNEHEDDTPLNFATRNQVLMYADAFAYYGLWTLMTYLIDVWKLSSTHAAAILNVRDGITETLPIILVFFSRTWGSFRSLLITGIAYAIGMGFMAMSTPPVTGSCSEYKKECIGAPQKALFYTALALIAVGVADLSVSLPQFTSDQYSKGIEVGDNDAAHIETHQGRVEDPLEIKEKQVVQLPDEAHIETHQGHVEDPPEIKEKQVVQLPDEAHIETHQGHVEDPPEIKEKQVVQLPQETENEMELGEATMIVCKVILMVILPIFSIGGAIAVQFIKPWSLRFGIPAIVTLLATIIFSTVTCSKSYKFYIRAPKISVRMVPVLLTFIVCGLINSMGNTYFLDQANKMNRRVGSIKVPIVILQVFYEGVGFSFRGLYCLFAYLSKKHTITDPCAGIRVMRHLRKYTPPIGIAVGMIFSILCCITAAKIEVKRLDVIRDHGLLDKPDDTIPLTVLKLLPQFILLGAFEGMFKASANDFLRGQGLPPIGSIFVGGMCGLGSLSSALLVFIFGKFPETNWFHEISNRSRLDKFYWFLSVVSSVNLVFYIVVASTCYSYGEDEEPEKGAGEDVLERGLLTLDGIRDDIL